MAQSGAALVTDPAIWFRYRKLNVIVSGGEFQHVVYIEPSWRSMTALAVAFTQERFEVAGCLGLFGHWFPPWPRLSFERLMVSIVDKARDDI